MFCINLGSIVVSHGVLLVRILLKTAGIISSMFIIIATSIAGRTKTLHRLASKYYWTNMVEDIVAMVMIRLIFIIVNKTIVMRFTVALARSFPCMILLRSELYYVFNRCFTFQIVRCKTCEFNKLNRPNQRYVRVTEPWEVGGTCIKGLALMENIYISLKI